MSSSRKLSFSLIRTPTTTLTWSGPPSLDPEGNPFLVGSSGMTYWEIMSTPRMPPFPVAIEDDVFLSGTKFGQSIAGRGDGRLALFGLDLMDEERAAEFKNHRGQPYLIELQSVSSLDRERKIRLSSGYRSEHIPLSDSETKTTPRTPVRSTTLKFSTPTFRDNHSAPSSPKIRMPGSNDNDSPIHCNSRTSFVQGHIRQRSRLVTYGDGKGAKRGREEDEDQRVAMSPREERSSQRKRI
ncbi:hypothetical protein P7C73_g211, partial [Tremellales sp. Uapishka_1]